MISAFCSDDISVHFSVVLAGRIGRMYRPMHEQLLYTCAMHILMTSEGGTMDKL